MNFDKLVVKTLLIIAKILARYGDNSYSVEIEDLEKAIFENGGAK